MTDMTGKIALVTGASRGLGAAVAEALASAGAHVIAVARTSGALEELDDRIQAAGGTATLAPLDITNEESIASLCKSIFDRWGGVDLWVHTAIHAAPLSPVPYVDSKDWAKSVNINVTAAARLIANVEPLLKAKSGTAIHCDDPRTGQKFFGAYAASKSAQRALFASWAAETENANITVKGFKPAPMPTATRARFFPGEDRAPLKHPKEEAARLLQII